jgi:hypothetical protein
VRDHQAHGLLRRSGGGIEGNSILQNGSSDNPSYSYGLRREDPTGVIDSSGLYSPAKSISGDFVWEVPKSDIIVAWKSHATSRRQAGSDAVFDKIIAEISKYLAPMPKKIDVPYTTRIYQAQLK